MSSQIMRTYRTANKLTLEQFGARFGVHKTTVMRWEADGPPAERALEIEKATGVPRWQLRPDLWDEPKKGRAA